MAYGLNLAGAHREQQDAIRGAKDKDSAGDIVMMDLEDDLDDGADDVGADQDDENEQAAGPQPDPVDYELLISVAHGLGRWMQDTTTGQKVYVKDQDCIVKVLTYLTMPVDPATSKPEIQEGFVRDVKEAMLQPDALVAVLGLIAEPLAAHPRLSPEQQGAVQLVLVLLRNLLAVPDERPSPTLAAGSSRTRLQASLLSLLFSENILELLLLVAQHGTQAPLRREMPTLLEILYDTYRNVTPQQLLAAKPPPPPRAAQQQRKQQPAPPKAPAAPTGAAAGGGGGGGVRPSLAAFHSTVAAQLRRQQLAAAAKLRGAPGGAGVVMSRPGAAGGRFVIAHADDPGQRRTFLARPAAGGTAATTVKQQIVEAPPKLDGGSRSGASGSSSGSSWAVRDAVLLWKLRCFADDLLESGYNQVMEVIRRDVSAGVGEAQAAAGGTMGWDTFHLVCKLWVEQADTSAKLRDWELQAVSMRLLCEMLAVLTTALERGGFLVRAKKRRGGVGKRKKQQLEQEEGEGEKEGDAGEGEGGEGGEGGGEEGEGGKRAGGSGKAPLDELEEGDGGDEDDDDDEDEDEDDDAGGGGGRRGRGGGVERPLDLTSKIRGKLAQPAVIYFAVQLLACYRSLPPEVPRAIASLLYRIAGKEHLDMEPLLYQVSVLRVFYMLLSDPDLRSPSKLPYYQGVLLLATRVMLRRRFMKTVRVGNGRSKRSGQAGQAAGNDGGGGRGGLRLNAAQEALLLSLFERHNASKHNADLILEGMKRGAGEKEAAGEAAGAGGVEMSLGQLMRQLKKMGLRFKQLTENQISRLSSLHSRYRTDPDCHLMIAAQLPGGWTSKDIKRLLVKHGMEQVRRRGTRREEVSGSEAGSDSDSGGGEDGEDDPDVAALDEEELGVLWEEHGGSPDAAAKIAAALISPVPAAAVTKKLRQMGLMKRDKQKRRKGAGREGGEEKRRGSRRGGGGEVDVAALRRLYEEHKARPDHLNVIAAFLPGGKTVKQVQRLLRAHGLLDDESIRRKRARDAAERTRLVALYQQTRGSAGDQLEAMARLMPDLAGGPRQVAKLLRKHGLTAAPEGAGRGRGRGKGGSGGGEEEELHQQGEDEEGERRGKGPRAAGGGSGGAEEHSGGGARSTKVREPDPDRILQALAGIQDAYDADGRWMSPHAAAAWVTKQLTAAESLWQLAGGATSDYCLVLTCDEDEDFFMTEYAHDRPSSSPHFLHPQYTHTHTHTIPHIPHLPYPNPALNHLNNNPSPPHLKPLSPLPSSPDNDNDDDDDDNDRGGGADGDEGSGGGGRHVVTGHQGAQGRARGKARAAGARAQGRAKKRSSKSKSEVGKQEEEQEEEEKEAAAGGTEHPRGRTRRLPDALGGSSGSEGEGDRPTGRNRTAPATGQPPGRKGGRDVGPAGGAGAGGGGGGGGMAVGASDGGPGEGGVGGDADARRRALAEIARRRQEQARRQQELIKGQSCGTVKNPAHAYSISVRS
ncbi:hypothetical protein VOLCADRAFT_92689 [Volvox carteri f. nagariensis]|uniref:Timeless N-terminal domain-containing protein n=1 Tax=Volvox carteri f. nagariensis TaxID=3068 RepID=D8U095_VOLCA|nr:uncharacterized protein VOLCADRAFT_92689 [Volvox carteri f. nagariensis]EFJ46824.1 hypothetical protein VOLCADRAFT_92689 [Volvox carteri f. nagariensis]|eukprot:XP_002952033.1 hypothetical protein VOLCADRAFT_92689 [Volvox carteri f. nagariensis]